MIEAGSYRPNVGIIIANHRGRLLWARRAGQNAWQFPQGGIRPDETLEQALYRELREETGLAADDVKVLHCTSGWLYYRLPKKLVRFHQHPLRIGQKQKWFMLMLESDDDKVNLASSERPEFDDWRWVDYWYPLEQVIYFKRNVYRKALQELQDPLNDYLKHRQEARGASPGA